MNQQRENGRPDRGNGDAQTTHDQNRFLVPPVDIYEDNDGLTILADLPGVKKGDLSVTVDQNVLTVKGKVSYTIAEGAVVREFGLADYHRQFRLSHEFDTQRIRAELKHGVLNLRLPKSENARPRHVEINVES